MKLNFMKKLYALFLSLLFFVACDLSTKSEESKFYQISESLEFSKNNNLLVDTYDLEIYRESDTLILRDYAWVENKWFQTTDKFGNTTFNATLENQLVIPINSYFHNCEKNLTDCNLDLVDNNGQYFSRMDTVYAYKILSGSDICQIPFNVEIDNRVFSSFRIVNGSPLQ